MNIARCIAFGLIFSIVVGCGGGGTGSSAPVVNPPAPAPEVVPPPTRTLVTLQSDPGDVIGQGNNYSYANTNATITLNARGSLLSITVVGDQSWTADFQTGGTATELKVGMYTDLDAYVPSAGTAKPGLRWYGEQRGCATSKGWFAIDSVAYADGGLKSISLRFERHCDGAAPALHGVVQFTRDDKSAPPELMPVPADLWRPPAGTGAGVSGSYVYLESSAGDYVGLGKTYRYDSSNSEIFSYASGSSISILINGDEQWKAIFQTMQSVYNLKVGYYPELHAYPLHNPTRGGMYWTGEGRGCSLINAWFAIDAVIVENGQVTGYDLRFEQHCEGRAAALRGAVHWRADAVVTPVTISPSAAGSWRAPADAANTTGNYLYLEGDPSGMPRYRQRHLFTDANATLAATASGRALRVVAQGPQQWQGDIELGDSSAPLAPGLYSGLVRLMYPGQAAPGMSWSGEHRGCFDPHGWVAIDSVAYDRGQLSAIDLRFEQTCDGGPLPFHGAFHWRAAAAGPAPGPAAAPADMWRPPAALVPASGNYVYLALDRTDFIGGGSAYRYTAADAVIAAAQTDGTLLLTVDGDEHWTMHLAPMRGHTRLEPGYYDGLAGYPFYNPARGGFDWSGEARGCNIAQSGVIIDSVSYDNDRLIAVELRFEQHCENSNGALRGAVRWSAAAQSAPAGPVLPIPPLWKAPAGVTPPASGSYVLLESDPGEFIGSDPATLSRTPTLPVSVSATGNRLHIEVAGGVNGSPLWIADFVTMNSLNQIQPGFYDKLRSAVTHNPLRGGFTWYGDGHGCNTSLSWVAIDKVVYTNGQVSALDARFAQDCEMRGPALRGVIHWVK